MAERIFKPDGAGGFILLTVRDPAHRYRYTTHPIDRDNIYLEFTSAEETARDTEDALPPPPYSGFGRCLATLTGQVIPNATATAFLFTNEIRDVGNFHNNVNQDRFTIPVAQAGLYTVTCWCRFNESTVGAGGTANAGDRVLQIRQGGAALVSVRQRAAAASDTECVASAEIEFAEGDIIRAGVFQNSGGTMNVDARFTLRRVAGSDNS